MSFLGRLQIFSAAVRQWLLLVAVGGAMCWISYEGLRNYFPDHYAAVLAVIVSLAVAIAGYKTVAAWCEGMRGLACFYGLLTAGALFIAGQMDGLTWSAGMSHESGDRGKRNSTAAGATVLEQNLLSAKRDLETERIQIATLTAEIAATEEIHRSFADKRATIERLKTDGYRATTLQAAELQKELDRELALAIPAPELAGKRAILRGAVARESKLSAGLADLQSAVNIARAEAVTAEANQNFILGYAERFAGGDANKASALLAGYGWLLWGLMELFFCSLSGGIAYAAHQRRHHHQQRQQAATTKYGSRWGMRAGALGSDHQQCDPVVAGGDNGAGGHVVGSSHPEPPSKEEPEPTLPAVALGADILQFPLGRADAVNPIARNFRERAKYNGQPILGLEPRILRLTVAEVEEGLARHDEDKLFRRLNNIFNLGYKSKEIDSFVQQVTRRKLRRILGDRSRCPEQTIYEMFCEAGVIPLDKAQLVA
jgi:hypothetical protein